MPRRGLRLPLPSELGRSTCLEIAALADDCGIDTVWVPETWSRNSVVLMTQIAERGIDAAVGSGIVNVFSRTPGLVAMTAAGMAEVTGGRFRLGLGASAPAVVEGFHGIPFDRPLRRTREYVEVVNRLLDGDRIDYDGEIFDLSGFSIEDPVDHDVPVYLAAMGEKNLALTGEFADGWLPLFVPVHEFEDALATIAEGANRRGRTVDDIDVAPYVVTCISEDDPEGARDLVRSMLAFYVGAMGEFYYRTVKRFGYGAAADGIRDAWEAGNRDAARGAVTDELLRAFAICGSPEAAGERLAAYEATDVDAPVAYVPTGADPAVVRETVEWFARL